MYLFGLIALFNIVSAVSEIDTSKFLTSLGPVECGSNYKVSFEIFPTTIENDNMGILHITDEMIVEFQYMSSELRISKKTNQGVIELASTVPLELNEWTAVTLDVKRRSLGLTAGGGTFVNQHISWGHIHGYLGTMKSVAGEIDSPANAQIRNIAVTCVKRKDTVDTDYVDVNSVLYRRKIDLGGCRIVSII